MVLELVIHRLAMKLNPWISKVGNVLYVDNIFANTYSSTIPTLPLQQNHIYRLNLMLGFERSGMKTFITFL